MEPDIHTRYTPIMRPLLAVILVLPVVFGLTMYFILKARNQSQQAYEAALREYSNSPDDPALREEALQKGLDHARFTGGYRSMGFNGFAGSYRPWGIDEFTVRNDLDMIDRRRFIHTPDRGPRTGDPAARLRKLSSIYDQGLITVAEFTARRAEIIAEI